MTSPTLPSQLRRDDPRPLHQRLREDLRQRITTGGWQAQQRIPSEAELMRHYGVSRITVQVAARLGLPEGRTATHIRHAHPPRAPAGRLAAVGGPMLADPGPG